MSEDISSKIVDKIKSEKIKLKPKVFDYKSFLFWMTFAFLIVLGGLTFSLVLMSIFSFGRDNFRYASGGFLKIFFASIPYLWLILFGLFGYFGFRAFRSTSKGYRQNFLLILLIILLASFSLGSLLHMIGFSRVMHRAMSNNVPFYNRVAPTEEGQWSRPRMGMVGGQIIETGDNFIVVKDIRSNNVMVIYSEESVIGEGVELQTGERVRVLGERVDKKAFRADVIQVWDGGDMLSPQDKERIRNFRRERMR